MVSDARRSTRTATTKSVIDSLARQSLPKKNRGGTGRPKKSDARLGDDGSSGHPSRGKRRRGVGLSIGSARDGRKGLGTAPTNNLREWALRGYSHAGMFRELTLESLSRAGDRLSELYRLYRNIDAHERQGFKRLQERDAKQGRGAQPSGACPPPQYV